MPGDLALAGMPESDGGVTQQERIAQKIEELSDHLAARAEDVISHYPAWAKAIILNEVALKLVKRAVELEAA